MMNQGHLLGVRRKRRPFEIVVVEYKDIDESENVEVLLGGIHI